MTQTFDASTRTEAPVRADEVTALRGFLDYHRDTFRMKCAGLTQQQLAQTHPPSAMTLGGAPYPPLFDGVDWQADPDWEWRTATEDDPLELRAIYDDCVRRADDAIDEALARGGLDAESVEQSSSDGAFSLRWILLHMLEEYARHNGHADLLRESIDGETGE